MRALHLLGLGAIAACFDPTYRDLACGANGACPDGLACVANVCVAELAIDARADAPDPDGATDALVDAAPPDARSDAPIDALAPCPDGDVTSPTDPTRCFRFVPTLRTWAAAHEACTGLGGRLADVRNSQENQSLIVLVSDTAATWLGGSDAAMEGSWLWTDGVPFSFNAWGENQPSNVPGENCLRYVGQRVVGYGPSDWSDQPCDRLFPSICVRTP